jgi:hypothetical protein
MSKKSKKSAAAVSLVLKKAEECWTRGWPLVISTTTEGGISYSYTVGLPKLIGREELAVSGMPEPIARAILNSVYTQLRARVDSKEQVFDVLVPLDEKKAASFRLHAHPIADPSKRLKVACNFPSMEACVNYKKAVQLAWASAVRGKNVKELSYTLRFPSKEQPSL